MSSTNLQIATGRLGSDAKVLPGSNGRTGFRFSLATDRIGENSERSTCWIPVIYWTASEREIAFLQERLVKGSLVSAHGPFYSRRYQHNEYPIDIESWDLHAVKVDVLIWARSESETPSASPAAAQPNPAPQSTRPNRAQAPAPAATPAFASSMPADTGMLKF